MSRTVTYAPCRQRRPARNNIPGTGSDEAGHGKPSTPTGGRVEAIATPSQWGIIGAHLSRASSLPLRPFCTLPVVPSWPRVASAMNCAVLVDDGSRLELAPAGASGHRMSVHVSRKAGSTWTRWRPAGRWSRRRSSRPKILSRSRVRDARLAGQLSRSTSSRARPRREGSRHARAQGPSRAGLSPLTRAGGRRPVRVLSDQVIARVGAQPSS